MQAVVFEVVAAKMFQAYSDALPLYALYVALRHPSRENRILRKIFKVPAVQRIAFDIYPGCEQNIYIAVDTVVAERHTHLLCTFGSPCVRQKLDGRIGHCRIGGFRPVLPAFFYHAQSDRSVRHGDLRKFSPKIIRMPKILAAD